MIFPIFLVGCSKSNFEVEKDLDQVIVAYKSNNITICNEITNEDYKNWCFAIVIEDQRFCQLITSTSKKNLCFRDLALYSENETACKEINDSHERDICFESVAFKKKDKTICQKISLYTIERERCFDRIARSTSK